MWNWELGHIDAKSSIGDNYYDLNTFYKCALCFFLPFPCSTQLGPLWGQHQITHLTKSQLGECQNQSKPFKKKREFPSSLGVADTLLCVSWVAAPVVADPHPPSCPPASSVGQGLKMEGLEPGRKMGQLWRNRSRWGERGLGPSTVGHWPWALWLSCHSSLKHSTRSDPQLEWRSLWMSYWEESQK